MSSTELTALERAIDIAVRAHAGETDKAGATYIRHPLRLMEAMDTETERIVAVLHDVVEDADYTLDDIEAEFGTEVRTAVDHLTARDEETYTEFIERAREHEIARKVKRADLADNLDLTRVAGQDPPPKLEAYLEAYNRL